MVKIVLYTNTISPHQLPLAKELAARVGNDNFKYIYTDVVDKDHGALGWSLDVPQWCIHVSDVDAGEWLENADILLSGLRCFDLFERRAKKGLKNFYMTERWFKPPIGILRLLHPRYLGYASRLCRLLKSGAVVGLPIGIHAASDMARLCGLMHGDLRCLFRVPKLDFESKPGGRIFLTSSPLPLPATAKSPLQLPTTTTTKYCLDKMRMWGYFVEPSKLTSQSAQIENTNSKLKTLRVLWVGRLLDWKCVDTIIKAVGELSKKTKAMLDVYGTGPEENQLKKLAANYGDCINFYPPVPINEVRKLMREHDVYVLASNGYEGWGAVVSEALEEGMKVVGTYEAGSSATILPDECLFHAGDEKSLLAKLGNTFDMGIEVSEWCPSSAATTLANI